MSPRMTRADALHTVLHRRGQIREIMAQEIPTREMGRRLVTELEHWMWAAFFTDTELEMMSTEFLVELAQHGWWSRAGRLKIHKLAGF